MKKVIALIFAGTLVFAGCLMKDDEPAPTRSNETAQMFWESSSEEERAEACGWAEDMSEDSLFMMFKAAADEDVDETTIRDLVKIIEEDC